MSSEINFILSDFGIETNQLDYNDDHDYSSKLMNSDEEELLKDIDILSMKSINCAAITLFDPVATFD